MKTACLVGCFVLASSVCGWTQSPEIVRVKGGQEAEKQLPIPIRYRYPVFRPGKVLYVTGTVVTARLNYSLLLDEMQFIDSRGDTMALADEPVVKWIEIDTGLFYYDRSNGYVEIISDHNGTKLAVRQNLKNAVNERQGGYEQSSGVSAIRTYRFYASGNTAVNSLESKGDILLTRNRTYYIIDKNGRLYPANKNNVLKVFVQHKRQIQQYITNEAVDFMQEVSLKKLLTYASELP